MVSRHKEMRSALIEHLELLGTPGSWSHVIQQTGMYCYLGLTSQFLFHYLLIFLLGKRFF